MPEKKYEHLEKYKSLKEKVRRIVDTTELEHRNAYNKAIELLRDKEGLIEYKKLKENDMQLKFADEMAAHYVERAQKALGAKINKDDEFQAALLTNAYAGVTKAQLRLIIGKSKHKFNFDSFKELYQKGFMKNIKATLYTTASQHLTDKHINDIIEYIGIGKIKEFQKDYITREHAISLLDVYHEKGESLTKSDLEKMIGGEDGLPEQILKKEKKKKES